MDKYDLLDAMSGIRDEYIETAARSGTDAKGRESSQESFITAEPGEGPFHKKRKRGWIRRMRYWAGTAAAVLFVSILLPNLSPQAYSAFSDLPVLGPYFRLVTFRTYEYSDERSEAHVEEPAVLTMGSLKTQESIEAAEESMEAAEESVEAADEEALPEPFSADSDSVASDETDPGIMMSGQNGDAALSADSDPGESAEDERELTMSAGGGDASLRAELSAARISAEIRKMAEDCIQDFEKDIAEGTGYRSLYFTHEVVTDSEDWFCLEVRTYTSSADGFEQTNHFVINKKTGQIETLMSLFGEDTDYVTPISHNIIEQMRAQMTEDPDVEYWLDSEEEPEMDFSRIREDQDFYIDKNGDLVICFNELEAAPMYMGTVEFTIPPEVISGLKK